MKRIRFTRLETVVDKEVVVISQEENHEGHYWVLHEVTPEEIELDAKNGYPGIFGTTGAPLRGEQVLYARPGFDLFSDETIGDLTMDSSKYRWEKVKHLSGVGMTTQSPTELMFYEDDSNQGFVSILEDIEE
jgi:hypothetical protein